MSGQNPPRLRLARVASSGLRNVGFSPAIRRHSGFRVEDSGLGPVACNRSVLEPQHFVLQRSGSKGCS